MLCSKRWSTFLAAGLLTMAGSALAQQPAAQQPEPVAAPAQQAPEASSIEIPAGTKVLLSLRSAIHTKTAKPGDGVYLTSNFPVVVENRVVIPPGVYVQGVIDEVVRPGRVKGRAAVHMHFTSMIFPNGTVVNIPGVVSGLPGSAGPTVQKEGEIQQSSGKGKDAGNVTRTTISGATLGTIGGAVAGSPGMGAGIGAAAGATVGLVSTLFTRGNDVVLNAGQGVEMVLQRPLTITEANLSGSHFVGHATGASSPPTMVRRNSAPLSPNPLPH
jgi:type IV secretion system protein VirB10